MRLKRNFFFFTVFHFMEFWWYYLLAIASLYILNLSQVKIPALAKNLADSILSDDKQSEHIQLFVLLAVAIIFFRTMSRWLFFYPARVQQKFLREELIHYISKISPKAYLDFSPGQLYQILLNDIDRLRGFIGFGLLQVGNVIIAVYVLYPKVVEIDKSIVVAFVPMLVSVLVFTIVMFFFIPFMRAAQNIQGDVQNVIIETFEAKFSISSFQREMAFIDHFDGVSQKELKNFFYSSVGPSLTRPLIPFGMAISLLWGAWLIFKLKLGVTTIILFSGFLFLVLEPLMFLSWIGMVISSAWASWGRIKSFLETTSQFKDPSDFVIETTDKRNLYRGTMWDGRLKLAIKQKRGEVLGLCGPTGVGKTHWMLNLADALIRAGKKISFVMQEPHLFDDTIGNNLLLGRKLTSEMEKKLRALFSAFEFSQIGHDFNEIMNTVVGENGKKLSGGQIKRLALVRSLIGDAEYVLWDDPFSSVDGFIEAKIIRMLKNEGIFLHKFLIFSSHRKSSFLLGDKIIYLRNEESYIEEASHGKIPAGEIERFFSTQVVQPS